MEPFATRLGVGAYVSTAGRRLLVWKPLRIIFSGATACSPASDSQSSAMASAHNPITIVCRTCGSKDVSRDAGGEWDEQGQQWVLRTVFDAAYCHACDAETSLDEEPLVPANT